MSIEEGHKLMGEEFQKKLLIKIKKTTYKKKGEDAGGNNTKRVKEEDYRESILLRGVAKEQAERENKKYEKRTKGKCQAVQEVT